MPLQVACGEAHTLGLDDNGAAYSWGWNAYGQLGLRNTANRRIPKKIECGGKLISSVAAGWAHSLAVTTEQQMMGWGWGKFGQIGVGRAINSDHPLAIDELEGE